MGVFNKFKDLMGLRSTKKRMKWRWKRRITRYRKEVGRYEAASHISAKV